MIEAALPEPFANAATGRLGITADLAVQAAPAPAGSDDLRSLYGPVGDRVTGAPEAEEGVVLLQTSCADTGCWAAGQGAATRGERRQDLRFVICDS